MYLYVLMWIQQVSQYGYYLKRIAYLVVNESGMSSFVRGSISLNQNCFLVRMRTKWAIAYSDEVCTYCFIICQLYVHMIGSGKGW